MTPRIGVLTVKGIDYHPTRRLAEAAAVRKADVVVINPYDVMPSYQSDRPLLHSQPDMSDIHALFPRQGAEIKTACLPLIAHYEQMGVPVINGSRSIRTARNKFFMLQAMTRCGLPVPDTVYAASMAGCLQARAHFAPDPVVLKPIQGRQGTGLHRLPPDADVPPDVAEQLAIGNGILVQAYQPPHGRRDFRVFVIGDAVAGAITLTPPEGDFRTNAHIGGQPAPVDLSTEMAALTLRAARSIGLEIAGVDMMVTANGKPLLVEVNSAPGFRAMEAVAGKDIAGQMIDYALAKIQLT